jgi:hypothetical protein
MVDNEAVICHYHSPNTLFVGTFINMYEILELGKAFGLKVSREESN